MPLLYRFDGLDLLPGNKTAGFDFSFPREAAFALARLPLPSDQRTRLVERARERALRARVANRRDVGSLNIYFWRDSWLPRFFVEEPTFGGSLGTDPEHFSRLETLDTLPWVEELVRYSPHNVDTPRQALRLWVLAQTWAEDVPFDAVPR